MNRTDLKILALIFGVGIIILFVLRMVGFDGLYGQDAYEYIRQSGEMKNALLNLSMPEDFYWAPGYPLFIAVLDLTLGNISLSAQILSMITWSFTVFLCFKMIEQTGLEKKKISLLLSLSIVGFAAYFFRIYYTSMSDGLATMCVTAAVFFLEKYRLKISSVNALLAVLFASLGVFTRYAVLPISAIIVGYCFILLLKNKNWKIALSALLISIGLGWVFFLLKNSSANEIVQNSIVRNWNISNYWKTSYMNNQASMSYSTPNFIYVLYPIGHLGFIWPAVPLIVYSLIKKIAIKPLWLIVTIIMYLLFLAGIPFQNKRFLIVTIPLIFIALAPSLIQLVSKIKRSSLLISIIGIMLFNIGLTIYSFEKVYQIHQNELVLFECLEKYQIDHLYTFEVDLAIKTRGFKGSITNLWLANEVNLKPREFVLMNPEKWEQQWKHHQLMKNVNSILDQENIILVDSLENGWKLWMYE